MPASPIRTIAGTAFASAARRAGRAAVRRIDNGVVIPAGTAVSAVETRRRRPRAWRVIDVSYSSVADLGGPELVALAKRLPAAERERAATIRADAARARFVAARLLVRRSASTVVGCAPDDVRIEVDDVGRPFVVKSPTPLHISIAHSGDYVVVAVAGRRVGVDIERLPTTPLQLGIAERICSVTELRDVARLDPALRERAVMGLWTRKEAYGKAIGVGLGFPVRTITAGPGGSRITATDPRLPATRWDPDDRWRVVDLPVDPAYAAALVADGRRWQAHTHAVGRADF